MNQSPEIRWAWSGALAQVILLALPTAVAAGVTPTNYFTAPSDAPARDIALTYLDDAAAELGLDAGDVADVAVTDLVVSPHNGVTHVYLRQRVHGL